MRTLAILLSLAGILSGSSGADSDICADSSAYDETASSAIDGCTGAGGSVCDDAGNYLCSFIVPELTALYASAITTCSLAEMHDDGVSSEADSTILLASGCCTDATSVCHSPSPVPTPAPTQTYSVICADNAAYNESASSRVSGCDPRGESCDKDGYWLCSHAVADATNLYASDVAACSTAVTSDDDLPRPEDSGSFDTEKTTTQYLGSTCCTDQTSACGKYDTAVNAGSSIAPSSALALTLVLATSLTTLLS